ncbi:MAG: transposase [Turicibacter sanguinis]|uniref:IS66 family transposase n=1 Tax=Turicibacter sanguinis TaxID=154288 RepID=UPI002F931B28
MATITLCDERETSNSCDLCFKLKDRNLTFLEDRNLEASNNLSEQAIGPIAIGRKNYLFSTSMKGVTANAMAYTIIETAKANSLNSSKYLTYLLKNYLIRTSYEMQAYWWTFCHG